MSVVRGASRPPVEMGHLRSPRLAPRVGVLLLVLSAVFFGVNFSQQWWWGHQVQQRVDGLRAAVAQTQQQVAQEKAQIVYLHSKPYIISEAYRLGLVRHGDAAIFVQQQDPIVKVVYKKVLVQRSPPAQSVFIHLLQAIFQ